MDKNNLPDFNQLWDYQNPKETEEKFRAILAEIDENKHPDYVAELQTQIARTLGLQQLFEEGHQLLDTINIKNHNALVQTRFYLEKGRLFNSNQERYKALPLFHKAYEIGIEHHLDYYAIDAAHMIAYALIKEPNKKIEWEEKALKLVQETTDDKAKKWEGSLYNNLGWSYFDLADYETAKKYFNLSLNYETAKNNESKAIIAKWSIAKCERMQNNLATALQSFLALENEISSKDLPPDGYVFEEIGECYLSLQDSIKAQPYFKQAYQILSKDIWLQKNEKERLDRLFQLGQ